MKKLIIGCIFTVLGLYGLAAFWSALFTILTGTIPLILLIGGGAVVFFNLDKLFSSPEERLTPSAFGGDTAAPVATEISPSDTEGRFRKEGKSPAAVAVPPAVAGISQTAGESPAEAEASADASPAPEAVVTEAEASPAPPGVADDAGKEPEPLESKDKESASAVAENTDEAALGSAETEVVENAAEAITETREQELPMNTGESGEQFFGNTGSMVFHDASCKYAGNKKCTAVFSTKADALAAGYKPCKLCFRE